MTRERKRMIALGVAAAILGGAVALWLWWSAPSPVIVQQRERTDELLDRIALAAKEADKRAEKRVAEYEKEVVSRAASIRKEIRVLPADGVALELSGAIREYRQRGSNDE